MRRLVAALACRMEGSRLYGKPLQNLDVEGGVTILGHLVSLIDTVGEIDETVLGVAEGDANVPFIRFAAEKGVRHIVGSERDVLQRLIDCAEASEATDVFRVTTESPFTYFEAIPEAWARHVAQGNDVTTIDGLPEGSHFEIYTLESLRESHERGDERHRSELCSLYVREHREDFRVEVLEIPPGLERLDLRLTVDYPEDLVLCRGVYARLAELAPRIPVERIISYLDESPELVRLVEPYVCARYIW